VKITATTKFVSVHLFSISIRSGAIRKSAPVIVGSLLVMVTALTFSILGNSKRDVRTLVAAILYVCAGQSRDSNTPYAAVIGLLASAADGDWRLTSNQSDQINDPLSYSN
jgi:hypothetical protein